MKKLLAVIIVSISPLLAFAEGEPLTCPEATYLANSRWATAPAGGIAGPVVYRLSTTLSADVPREVSVAALERAVDAWNKVTCAEGARPSFYMQRGQDHPAADNGGAADTTTHVIYWQESGWQSDSFAIAMASTQILTDSGYIITSDIAFNGELFNFRAKGTDENMYGCSATGEDADKCYDLEQIALHELGHFIGFDHVPCTDAIMFPIADPSRNAIGLSQHERAGLCALYPPRPTSTARTFGEACDAGAPCASALTCLTSASGTYGLCTMLCESSAGCPDAYMCNTTSASVGFCRPGTSINQGYPDDLCGSCVEGEDCASGLCVKDGVHTLGICTLPCDPTGDAGIAGMCPIGMDCIASDDGYICWPRSDFDCADAGELMGLNEECYDQAASAFTSCEDLHICFVFRALATGKRGACIPYCNNSDKPCEIPGQTCCYGVDERGSCLSTPPVGPGHGGCFQLQREGQLCSLPTHSVCQNGHECIMSDPDNPQSARCYKRCDNAACGINQNCIAYDNGLMVCCNRGTGQTGQPACEPAARTYEIGVTCSSDNDCTLGLCLSGPGGSACTRLCDYANPCPGNIDVNADNLPDGGFDCTALPPNPGAYCWPKEGPAPVPDPRNITPPSGCSCRSAEPPSSGALFAIALLGLFWLRRRRVFCA